MQMEYSTHARGNFSDALELFDELETHNRHQVSLHRDNCQRSIADDRSQMARLLSPPCVSRTEEPRVAPCEDHQSIPVRSTSSSSSIEDAARDATTLYDDPESDGHDYATRKTRLSEKLQEPIEVVKCPSCLSRVRLLLENSVLRLYSTAELCIDL
jgi:hypothetical protein